MATTGDIGPQYAGDATFAARMRLHQSWWRAEVLGVGYGVGPTARGERLGNYLDDEAAAAGLNFLTPQIFEVVQERIAQGPGVEAYRCLHNMPSSQPMCFNLFGPLVRDHELATRRLLPLASPPPGRPSEGLPGASGNCPA